MPSLIQKYLLSKHFLLLLFLLIFLVRFIHLDADPSFVKRLSDISDETVWALDARNAVLFNDWFIGDLHVGLDSAPLYMYLLFWSFKIFGPTLYALRLVPAISGFLTAVLLYFLVRKLADQKQALLALCIFGFGNVVVVYNRLGHLESTLALFLLGAYTLWVLGKENKTKSKWFYAASGLFYGLAILVKVSAVLFFPALLAYWLFELSKDKLKLKEYYPRTVIFSLGATVPILVYLWVFLIPYWNKISQSLVTHGQNNFFGLTLPLNAFKVLGNNLFGLPSFYLLYLLFLFYLVWKLSQMEEFSWGEIVKKCSFLEGLALSWIFGGLLGILISDVSDRRFTIMFVPLAILVAHLILNFQRFSLGELFQKVGSEKFRPSLFSRFLYLLLVLLPAFSLPYLILRVMGKEAQLFQVGSWVILLGCLLGVLFLFILEKKSAASQKVLLHKLLFLQFLFFLIFDPLTTLLRHFSKHFSIAFSKMNLELYILVGATLFSLFILLLFFLKLWFRKETWLRQRQAILILSSYFAVSTVLVGNIVFFPSYTLMEGVGKLSEITEPGSLILGAAVEELLYGTNLLYLKYEPTHRVFWSLNNDIWERNPKYYLEARIFDGRENAIAPEVFIFEEIKSRYELKPLRTFYLYRYPFTEKYRAQFELYELSERTSFLNTTSEKNSNSPRNSISSPPEELNRIWKNVAFG